MQTVQKILIPEIMAKNDHYYYEPIVLMNLKLDLNGRNNHTVNVVMYNANTKKFEYVNISPELIRYRYRLGRSYRGGKQGDFYSIVDSIADFNIDTKAVNGRQIKISDVISENSLSGLFRGNKYWASIYKNTFCFNIEKEDFRLVIPLPVVMIYYYINSTKMKEAYFNGNVSLLYDSEKSDFDNIDDAKIVLKNGVFLSDAPLIYRFSKDKYANDMFNLMFTHLAILFKNGMANKNGTAPISHVNFPVMEEITVRCRYVELASEDSKKVYFVREIINDDSTIDFNSLTVVGRYRYIKSPGKSGKPRPVRFGPRRPKTIKPTVVEKPPSGINRFGYVFDNEQEFLNSLKGKNISYEEREDEQEPIYDGPESEAPAVDQSLLVPDGSGDEKLSKTLLGANGKATLEKKEVEVLPNFDKIVMCLSYLLSSGMTSDFAFDGVHREMPFPKIKLSPKAFIENRVRHYMYASFVYENLFVVVVDIENLPSENSASWLLISTEPIAYKKILDILWACFVRKVHILNLGEAFDVSGRFRFDRKNHLQTLDENSIEKWTYTLLGKCYV